MSNGTMALAVAVGRPGRRVALVGALFVLGALALPVLPAAPAKKKTKHPEPTAIPRPPDPNRVSFVASDGVTVVGTWRPIPGETRGPAVLLLHDFSRERRDWDVLSHDFLVHGLSTLAIDLRGHGDSTRKAGSETLRTSPRWLRDPNGFPRDVKAAISWLRERSGPIGVIGLSTGANLAVIATANGWADAGVAVSAFVPNLHKLAGPLPHSPKQTLVLASLKDPGREESALELHAEGSEPKKLVLFPGVAHNMLLLAENLEARKEAMTWMAARLGAVSPSTVGPGPGGGVFLSPMAGPGGLPPPPTPTPTPTPGAEKPAPAVKKDAP
jgi:alpha-beta hydrolase superfamily lysophospholipase